MINMASDKEQADREGADRKVSLIFDKKQYFYPSATATGAELRALVGLAGEYELLQIVPGGQDLVIEDSQVVELKNGMRFFSAPRNIAPGR